MAFTYSLNYNTEEIFKWTIRPYKAIPMTFVYNVHLSSLQKFFHHLHLLHQNLNKVLVLTISISFRYISNFFMILGAKMMTKRWYTPSTLCLVVFTSLTQRETSPNDRACYTALLVATGETSLDLLRAVHHTAHASVLPNLFDRTFSFRRLSFV
jgi:hypothetical protein